MCSKFLFLLGYLFCSWGIVFGISEIRAGRQKRVVGGDFAHDSEFPYQVWLTYNTGEYSMICGGSILSNDLILTAAHCVIDIEPSQIQISAGVRELFLDGENRSVNEQVRSVTQIHIHEDYNFVSLINDFAILELSEPLNYTSHVNRISLPRASEEFSGNVTVTGWGGAEEDGDAVYFLRKVDLPIVSNLGCKKMYEDDWMEIRIPKALLVYLNTALAAILNTTTPVKLAVEYNITDTMMCAGGVAGEGICQGGSGGPAVCTRSAGHGKEKESVICGIISHAFGCGEDGVPGIYIQVSNFTDWIENTEDKIMMRKTSPNPDAKHGKTETKQEIDNVANSTGTPSTTSCQIDQSYSFGKWKVHIIIIAGVVLSFVLVFLLGIKFCVGGLARRWNVWG